MRRVTDFIALMAPSLGATVLHAGVCGTGVRAIGVLSAGFLGIGLLGATSAQATVSVAIDLSHQTMHVESSSGTYNWPISSARAGFYTPNGSYAPTRLELMHYSHKYHMSPMPYAIFFRGGYAIHGTYSTASLGHPASHGCVRLSPGNAASLYGMVKAEGARISISGSPPTGSSRIARAEPRQRIARATDDARPETRRTLRRQRIDAAYAAQGYHYIGRMNGRDLYQAQPSEQPDFFNVFNQ